MVAVGGTAKYRLLRFLTNQHYCIKLSSHQFIVSILENSRVFPAIKDISKFILG